MRRLALPFALLCALLVPAAALGSGDDVLDDCGLDEKLDKSYTQEEYRQALDNIPADLRQYTNCQAVIRKAQLSAAGGGTGGSGGSGGNAGGSGGAGGTGAGGTGSGGESTASPAETLAAATPEQKEELAEVVAEAPAPVTLPGAGAVDPASAGEVPALSAVGDLPAPLGVLLVLMVAGAAVLGLNRVRTRVGGRRTA
ncbi:MAG: hypothetical protein JHC84_01185 [Solirubrobacteraceae bacterium]|nr:hypothetical protein [Solirubrobacteraceae bacterium]